MATDTAPRFDLHNVDGSGKALSPVEGCLGVVSIKSMLNKHSLQDALHGLASIPPTRPLDGRANPLIKIANYADWPFKIVYATDGIAGETLSEHISDFYDANPQIPIERRPNYIHVLGKYLFARGTPDTFLRNITTGTDARVTPGTYVGLELDADIQGLVWTLSQLQSNASASSHINFSYLKMMKKIIGIT